MQSALELLFHYNHFSLISLMVSIRAFLSVEVGGIRRVVVSLEDSVGWQVAMRPLGVLILGFQMILLDSNVIFLVREGQR